MHVRGGIALGVAAWLVAAGGTFARAQDPAASPDTPPPAASSASQLVPGPLSKPDQGAAELVRGNPAQAIATLTDALKDTGLANDRRAAVLNDRAVAYARTGQFKLAIEDYNKALQLFGEFPAAYNNRGNLLLSLGQYNEAIKDFDRAILLAPGYAAAYSNRANARVKLEQLDEAAYDFTKAIELMPQAAAPLSGRGLAYLAAGKPHAAIRDFSRAVNADARFASAYRNRAEARLLVKQNDEAIEDYSRAIAFDANNSELYIVRGYAYLAAANSASAIKDFSRALELDPRSAAAYQARGLANGIAEAYEEAYADLNRAIEIDARSAIAFAYRAYIYKLSNQADIGAKDIETALKLDPKSGEALWVRAEIAEARGQADIAVQDLRKALEINSKLTLASEALKRLGVESADTIAGKDIKELGFGPWRVVQRGAAYFAISADLQDLSIPLEMIGAGRPKLIDWEVKTAPNKGYGILRFSGGQVPAKSGPEDTELAALVDIENKKVLAIQPNKQGLRVANWTWEPDRVRVASIDGVTDEFQLRAAIETPVEAAAAPAPVKKTRAADGASGTAWSPWDQLSSPQARPEREPRTQRRAASKPKTIFDLLFGN